MDCSTLTIALKIIPLLSRSDAFNGKNLRVAKAPPYARTEGDLAPGGHRPRENSGGHNMGPRAGKERNNEMAVKY